MCISKRFKSTGATGGHGMQEIDVLQRRMIEEKFDQESCKTRVSCGNGCEFTLLGDDLTLRESLILGDHIQDNNLCPFCRTTNGKINFQFCVENHNKLKAFSFVMDGVRYDTMYKPTSYKFLPADMAEDNE